MLPVLVFILFIQQFQKPALPNCRTEKAMEALGLLDVQAIHPGIKVSLAYSEKENFIGFDVYGCVSRAFLQREAAMKLAQAQRALEKELPGYSLLIWDAARPRSAQKILWDSIKKPEKVKHVYVANPNRGSIHNYGCAVDLTIADPKGKAIDMGTGFDYFGELAQPRLEARLLKTGRLSATQITNRKRLRSIMQKAGFMPISSEWWHFNFCSLARAKSKYKPVP